MPLISWLAATDGRYWIDVSLGRQIFHVMIDLGLVDPLDLVGFELAPAEFQQLKRSGQLSHFLRRSRRDASGHLSWAESGMTTAQLFDPSSNKTVGPAVQVYVSCGSLGVPTVGKVFPPAPSQRFRTCQAQDKVHRVASN